MCCGTDVPKHKCSRNGERPNIILVSSNGGRIEYWYIVFMFIFSVAILSYRSFDRNDSLTYIPSLNFILFLSIFQFKAATIEMFGYS